MTFQNKLKMKSPLIGCPSSGLQITVSHRTMANQNLWKSDGIATLVGHSVPPIFCCNIWLYHLQITFDFLIRYSFESTFVFMSNQIFLLSDQNGALVGHMSFQGKQNYLQPCNLILRQTCKTFGINSYKKTHVSCNVLNNMLN